MVTLLAVRTHAGSYARCDARCHNSTHAACRCCCDGVYHGLREGSPALRQAVATYQPRLLALWTEAERFWWAIIEYARADLDSPPLIHGRGRQRDLQLPLPIQGGAGNPVDPDLPGFSYDPARARGLRDLLALRLEQATAAGFRANDQLAALGLLAARVIRDSRLRNTQEAAIDALARFIREALQIEP